MKCGVYKRFFQNFANEAKLDIIEALLKGPLSVSEIVEKVGGEQSAVSHNLKLLSECHIVMVEQQGKKRIYSINKDTVVPIIDLTRKHARRFCKGECGKK